ncbi:glycosyltransferase family 2 protein [Pseudoxanthomonas sp.]|uniref:glycosyltransferase family 2 protein n=1 Tax=Pseudoxanthomonas sp. TaxID=1871049 RepID=UPI0028C3E3FA|nr:glycosyltransferase family 2 protein [Pseudoxanthomonas sp.]
MKVALILLIACCLGAVIYSYVIYPVLLFVISGFAQGICDIRYVLGKRERRSPSDSGLPAVAVVISAYNEERHIRARIDNLLALDYPRELLHVYVGSDGSCDRTAEILAGFNQTAVRAYIFTENRGKASVLNDLVAHTCEPILLFSDANTLFARDAVRRLVAHFCVSDVGAVSGELRLLRSSGDNQDSLYWRVEQILKFFEARIGGLLGANGAIYAIRREFWVPLATDTICDDFCVAMSVAAAGQRLVYEPNAWAEEDTPDAISEEFHRRVRIGIGNFQALFRHPEYLFCTPVATRFSYVSHKVLRWIAPHLLIVALSASLIMASLQSHPWLLLASLQIVVYSGAALLYATSLGGVRLPSLFRILSFLFALNLAFLLASWRYVSGNYRGSWKRTRR